ncbi:rhodanese-like domain-containing protein 10 [Phragmites australis]|uniref:rhodanese-like domain-containing protein 10 n=1 Tax=Phragmites australis TaxID=29695 RepID=UPI002D76814D|nr:rhodanese-like domain-containing protein 10 [Phragmites australis]
MAMGAAATASTCFAASPSLSRCRSRVRAQATSPWAGGAEALVRSGAVRAVRPRDAAEALGAEGFRLLDVRPEWELARAGVRGSTHVPLFVGDDDMGPVTLLKKWVHFGYIGLWTGQSFTKMNDRFVDDVAAAVAGDGKDAKLLVACGEGLRSLIAVRMLHDDGYKNLAWLAGGFSKCVDGDFADVEGESKLQYATVGGASYIFLQILLLLGVVK